MIRLRIAERSTRRVVILALLLAVRSGPRRRAAPRSWRAPCAPWPAAAPIFAADSWRALIRCSDAAGSSSISAAACAPVARRPMRLRQTTGDSERAAAGQRLQLHAVHRQCPDIDRAEAISRSATATEARPASPPPRSGSPTARGCQLTPPSSQVAASPCTDGPAAARCPPPQASHTARHSDTRIAGSIAGSTAQRHRRCTRP